MKSRLYLLIFVFLILIPFIKAATNETTTSSTYSLDLNLDKNRIQLGDSVILSGTAYKDNSPMNEQVNMIFYFSSDLGENEVYLSVYDGKFSLSPKLRDLSSGTYQIDVKLLDLSGKELKYFDNVGSISVDNSLALDVKLGKDKLLPGDKLRITGLVERSLDKKKVQSGIVSIKIDGIERKTEISNGDLDYELVLEDNVPSDYHDVNIRAEDNFGNFGETSLRFYVIPKQESLAIELSKKIYSPNENLEFIVNLYDQAGEVIINDDVNVIIYNPKNKKVFEEKVSSGDSVLYSLGDYTLPGEWKISIKSNKLEADKYIEVSVVETLDIEVVGQILKVKNSGNIDYTKPLDIIATSETHNKSLVIRTGLAPGEEFSIELNKELRDLTYNLKILNTEENFEVTINDDRNVIEKTGDFFKSITGQAVHTSGTKNSNSASYIFGTIVIILVVAGTLFFNKKRKVRRNPKTKPSKKSKILFKKSKEQEDIEDFKTRILKDIEEAKIREHEDKKENGPYNVNPFFPVKETNEQPKKYNFDKPLSRDK